MGQNMGTAKLEDRYYLQKVKLGQGSFGTVWRAVDRQSNDVVAVKQLDKAAMPRRGVKRSDIEREIHVMQAVIGHENITRLLGFFEDPNSIYLALEYCDGGDFGDKVKERGMNLKEDEASDWMRQIIAGLASMHSKSICHRDIKPDNFMVHNAMIKLSDFGLALFLTPGRLLTEKCGTPAFMAPEQHKLPRQSRGYNELCDVWAAGVTMYMLMFGGKHPFLGNGHQLDEKRLLTGTLDFGMGQGFLGFSALSDGRYSEAARKLCQRLVEPEVNKRVSAEEARQDRWLTLGSRRRAAGPGEGLARAGTAPPGHLAVPGLGAPAGGAPAAAAGGPALPEPQRPARRGQAASTDELAAASGDCILQAHQVQDSNGRWWPFGGVPTPAGARAPVPSQDMDLPPNIVHAAHPDLPAASARAEVELQRRQKQIEVLQQQVRVQQEQNESQWEMMKQLEEEKKKLWPQFQAQASTENITNASRQAYVPDVAVKCPLPIGAQCRYNSSSWAGWIPARVQGFNEKDGTYNLDVRLHARPENISPNPDVSSSEAWPAGTLVYYESSSVRSWLPAVIKSFNEGSNGGEGSYNLDVRDCAATDRMRIRGV